MRVVDIIVHQASRLTRHCMVVLGAVQVDGKLLVREIRIFLLYCQSISREDSQVVKTSRIVVGNIQADLPVVVCS